MTTVTIQRNSLDRNFDLVFENVPNVKEFLFNYFTHWPQTAVIYENEVSENGKIPLEMPEDVEALDFLEGDIFVVIYPSGVIAALTALVWAANIGIALFAGGKKEKSTSDQVAVKKAKREAIESPNNGLSARANSQRLNQRIPEILGAVRSIPDLLLNPYTIYKENQQIELGYYCVGRGKYDISDIRDGDTKVADIGGNASVVVYGPNTSPNSGVAQLTVGNSILEPFVSIKPVGAVTGQTLFPPNAGSIESDDRMVALPNGLIYYTPYPYPTPNSWAENFQAGEFVTISSSNWFALPNLSGTYKILSITGFDMVLKDVNSVNANWASLAGGGTTYPLMTIAKSVTDRTVGPFIVENANSLYINLVAETGLYSLAADVQTPLDIVVTLSAQPVDLTDTPTGAVISKDIHIEGSNKAKTRIAITDILTLPSLGRYKVWAIRVTATNLTFDGTYNDTIICESMYAVTNITDSHFGNVTTIRTATYAGFETLKIKERKLNCLAKRIIPVRQGDGSYVDGITSKFADILRFVCLDSKIGNRDISELDLTNFYDTQTAVQTYFGTAKAIEFNYTFDEDEFSFEETVSIICEAVFCSAYRQGSMIRLFFEKETANSVLLFNHRNKIPNSEVRTIRFGTNNDKDGVELEYVDPKDGAKVIYYLPVDRSAINPEKISQLGVTNKLQAYFHAHRVFNRILYQNCLVEFDALQEAQILAREQRIQVADNTRTRTSDGEIVNIAGSTLTLSQDFEFELGFSYTIFLQNIDGSVISKAITAGLYKNQVVLANTTGITLGVADDLYTKSTYEIVENSSPRKQAFLVDERTNKENFIVTIKAINYDDRYYDGDDDFLTSVVDANGNLI